MSKFIQKAPILTGLRNEKVWEISNWLDVFIVRAREYLADIFNRLARGDQRLVNAILARSASIESVSDAELEQLLNCSRDRLKIEGINRSTIVESFAVVREVSGRVLSMRHHHTQIRVSISLLRGCIAEMATGEGKTLAATLACATAGLAGIPVHVVTINDYLAQRDGEEMTPLYQALGLSVGIITHDAELAERRQTYACDICFCSNKELTFDFLKDRLVLDGSENPRVLQAALLTKDSQWAEKLLLRGLHFAIVDEADSVLIDEARTPLIITQAGNGHSRRVSKGYSLRRK
jgi:preprotein translocase subunit SecA